MSEAKFTKGEWVAGRADMATIVDGYKSKWVYAGDKYCAVASGSDIDDWGEVMANAHLIAAAPEMYELLTDLRHTISLAGIIGADNTAVLKSIDNLLAKARGEA